MSRKSKSRESRQFAYEVSRRDFMKYMLAASSSALFMDPIRVLLGSLVDGLISNAQAQSTGLSPKKYFALIAAGGPPRWVFDLPLKANSGDAMPGNPLVTTRMTSGNRAYATVPMGDYHLPSLWSTGLPDSFGGMTSNMYPLAQNALMIRGIRGINSHGAGRDLVTRPDAAAPSLNGLVADHSHASIPAVNLAANQTFKSYSGVGEFRTNLTANGTGMSNNALSRALNPFIENRNNNDFFSRRDVLDAFIKDAMGTLKQHHDLGTPGISALYGNASKAENQIRQGVGNLSASYTTLVTKYRLIIDRVFTASDWQSKLGFGLNGLPFDASTVSKITNLAEVFAVVEYLFANNLSSTAHASIGNMVGINSDAHTENADTHLRGFSFYFRAVAACIHEFSKSVDWNNTVVQFGSEFSRTARASESGSDHGWEGVNTSVFSGAIKNGPYVVGNIQKDLTPGYFGVWGKGDLVKIDRGDKHLNMGNIASGMSHILGVESPTSNFASPIYLNSSGTISSTIGIPKLST